MIRTLVVTFSLALLAAGPPSVKIISIEPGQTITSPQIPVHVTVSNFDVECADVGKPGQAGRGHIHAMLDGMTMAQLTNFHCNTSFAISGAGVKPGTHVLAVTLANDAHADVSKPVMVKFAYAPAQMRPLPNAMAGGKPQVAIASPRNGAAVRKKFDLVLDVRHFDLSCDLEGKPNVAGWGHLHVFVQQNGVRDTKMHEMAGMVGMPCTKTIPIDLTTWRTGKARVLVMLVKNDHSPVGGVNSAGIDVTLK